MSPEGNALIEYGFARKPPPEGMNACSSYSLVPGDGSELRLWGFGLYYTEGVGGGLYVGRQEFYPRLVREMPGGVWKPSHLPGTPRPRTPEEHAAGRALLGGALSRVAAYERWVREEFGPVHREWCVATWRRATVTAGEMPGQWERLARFFKTGELEETTERNAS